MAKQQQHKYVGKDLFDEEDNESSSGFRKRIPHPYPKHPKETYDSSKNKEQLRVTTYERKEKEIKQKILQSSVRSINMLEESEVVGFQAGRELEYQGEKLKNINGEIDNIYGTLDASQREINGIKSIFHSFRKYIKPRSKHASNCHTGSRCASPSKFYTPIEVSRKCASLNRNFSPRPLLNESLTNGSNVNRDSFEQTLNENTVTMIQQINRLKEMSVAFNNEIDQQNEHIDIIHSKVETTGGTIIKQNKQLDKILRK